jgi:UDP-glucose 4-epimerase
MSKKVIVTGGAGFIGAHTVVELCKEGYVPVIVDNFSNTEESVIQGLEQIIGATPIVYKFDCADEQSMTRVFEKEKPFAVIHFAAYKAVGESVEQPLKYYENNLFSLVNMLKLMQRFDVRHLVFSSSCTVYSQPERLPVDETSPLLEATSPYGYTKQVCERIVRDTLHAYPQMGAALLRYFNPIGAHESALIGELPYGVPNNLVPFITQTAIGLRKQLTIFGDDYNTADGTCIRDYIHVTDLAKAHVKAINWLENHPSRCEAFNLGQGIGNSVLEVVKTFEKVTGQKLNYVIGKRREGDVEQVWANATKANEELGWKTELSLEKALEDAWRWEQRLAQTRS